METVKEQWRLIGALLWDSITLFQATHPETDHGQAQKARQPTGSH
jgi:hypothetical protein